jgi:hypothetical protein
MGAATVSRNPAAAPSPCIAAAPRVAGDAKALSVGEVEMTALRNFVQLYGLYRRNHGRLYSFTRAREIAFLSLPF